MTVCLICERLYVGLGVIHKVTLRAFHTQCPSCKIENVNHSAVPLNLMLVIKPCRRLICVVLSDVKDLLQKHSNE